jgi:hypothetical protein
MRFAIIAFGLLCCAGVQTRPGECVTACGMTAAAEGESCRELQEFEADVIYRVGWVAPLNPFMMCHAVDGWGVVVHPALASDRDGCAVGWQVVPDFCVRGYTHVGAKFIEVSNADWRPSSLAHEMVHVAELERTKGEGGHCWSQEMRDALTEVMGRVETSRPELDCSP